MRVWPSWLLCLLVLAAYANGLGAEFQFDDWQVIVDNPGVHGWAAFAEGMPGLRPLLKATYVVCWSLGEGPLSFHLFNVALHAFNTVLVAGVVWRLLARTGLDTGRAVAAAGLAAAVFALHPAQTESITYVSGRSGALMATFLLLAWRAHLLGDGPGPRWRATLGAAVLFVAAFGAKEHAWTFPLSVFLAELARPDCSWRRALRRTLPYLLVLGALAAAAMSVPAYRRLFAASLATRSLWDNLLTQVGGQYYLLTGPLLSLSVNADPDLPVSSGWSAELALEAGVLLALAGLCVWQWRRRPWLALGVAWMFAHLAATNSILPRQDVANDRQLYLALMGPGWMAGVLLGGIGSERLRQAAAAALLLVLGSATAVRNTDYATQTRFWEATAEASPGKARVWNNLGYARQQAGQTAAARQAYERALELDPELVKARINLMSLDPPAAEGPSREP